jgi:hypothetical protein
VDGSDHLVLLRLDSGTGLAAWTKEWTVAQVVLCQAMMLSQWFSIKVSNSLIGCRRKRFAP